MEMVQYVESLVSNDSGTCCALADRFVSMVMTIIADKRFMTF